MACLAFAVRVAAVFVLRSDRLEAQTYEHGEIARNLLQGKGFRVWFLGEEGLTSQQAPVYPALLAAVYAAFGIDAPAALLAMQLIQCALGAALVPAVVWLSWLTNSGTSRGEAIGWCAGLGMALYPTHVYAVTHIQVAVLASLLTVWLLALAIGARRRGSTGWSVAAGAVAGALVLTDPILSLAAAIACLLLVLPQQPQVQDRPAPGWGRLVVAYATTALLVVSPWMLRNRYVHGEWVFVKSTFGYAFWQGNNAQSFGTDKIPKASAQEFLDRRGAGLRNWNRAMWEARHETLYIDDVLLKPTGYRELRGMSEPEKSRYLMGQAMAQLRNDPGRYPRLCLQRLRYFLLFDETNPKARNSVYRMAHLGLLVASAIGLICVWPYRRSHWATVVLFVLVTGFHTLTITSARFHLPLEPIQMIWSGAAVAPVVQWFVAKAKRLRKRRSAAVAFELETGQSCPALPVVR